MYKFLTLVFVVISFHLTAQEQLSYQNTDSLTYSCYLTGDWDTLLKVGKEALAKQIDFKRLRQRMGYAYFIKADYFASQQQYEKALAFDKLDADTQAYLYYCGLYTGNEANTRLRAKNVSPELKEILHIRKTKLIDAVDVEYNYKSNDAGTLSKGHFTRSNPTYKRIGINSYLNYRTSLYISYSYYAQKIDTFRTKQPEYYAQLKYSINPKTTFNLAYHYLSPSVGSYTYPTHLYHFALNTRVYRYLFGINASTMTSTLSTVKQFGIRAGATLPGKTNISFNSIGNVVIESGKKRQIFSQLISARVMKNGWIEGNLTLGNLKNYNDNEALYVYNSLDATTFRSGVTFTWLMGKHATLVGNYTYDTKAYSENSNYKYNQYSFSGGLRWKF